MNDDEIYKKYLKYKKKYYDLIKKRLGESIYPTQGNDFFFLTIPKGHPKAGKEVPVDYKLRNIVLYFWEQGLITLGWDQGYEIYPDCFHQAFISFKKESIYHRKTLNIIKPILEKLFGKDNIVIKNMKLAWKSEEEATIGLAKHQKILKKFFTDNPDKILLENDMNAVYIIFRTKLIPEIHKKLKIIMPDYTKRCPGNLIPYVEK